MIKQWLACAGVYSLFARTVGAHRGRRLYVDQHVRPKTGDRILDIGCGPADILEALPPVDYHGFDLSPDYIAAAQRRFGGRGQFHVELVGTDTVSRYAGFDLVLATGVLHHLNDAEAVNLFRIAQAALKPAGRLVTLDGCFVPRQSPLARFFLRRDRGHYVREEAAYVALARQVFAQVQPRVRTDLLRIPYTHLVLECQKPSLPD